MIHKINCQCTKRAKPTSRSKIIMSGRTLITRANKIATKAWKRLWLSHQGQTRLHSFYLPSNSLSQSFNNPECNPNKSSCKPVSKEMSTFIKQNHWNKETLLHNNGLLFNFKSNIRNCLVNFQILFFVERLKSSHFLRTSFINIHCDLRTRPHAFSMQQSSVYPCMNSLSVLNSLHRLWIFYTTVKILN
jgi:hypothetical protein